MLIEGVFTWTFLRISNHQQALRIVLFEGRLPTYKTSPCGESLHALALYTRQRLSTKVVSDFKQFNSILKELQMTLSPQGSSHLNPVWAQICFSPTLPSTRAGENLICSRKSFHGLLC